MGSVLSLPKYLKHLIGPHEGIDLALFHDPFYLTGPQKNPKFSTVKLELETEE